MKNLMKIFGLLVTAMILTFTMTACSDPADNTGKLTITDIPTAHNGKFVVAIISITGEEKGLIAADDFDFTEKTYTAVKIKDGKAEIPLWIKGNNKLDNFTEEKTISLEVKIFNKETVKDSDTVVAAVNVASKTTSSSGDLTIKWEDGV
ncbi:MAG: hypothetical protein FWC19_02335 [Treponema sp.]|nr:hypothetical protein [Treponema sp.]